jgi:hypothetical protein
MGVRHFAGISIVAFDRHSPSRTSMHSTSPRLRGPRQRARVINHEPKGRCRQHFDTGKINRSNYRADTFRHEPAVPTAQYPRVILNRNDAEYRKWDYLRDERPIKPSESTSPFRDVDIQVFAVARMNSKWHERSGVKFLSDFLGVHG